MIEFETAQISKRANCFPKILTKIKSMYVTKHAHKENMIMTMAHVCIYVSMYFLFSV